MDTLQAGDRVSRFTILRPLGAGGMGEVYEAKDDALDRSVAVKILPPDLVASPDRLRRFTQEAKSASGLSHPHIVAIHEIGESKLHADGRSVHFIAMELVSGVTLREKMRGGQTPMKNVLRWMSQVADALAKAHAAGIVHRDLKPDNVMISNDGWAKVLDFGLAKLTQPDNGNSVVTSVRDKTAAGVVVGTVGYMAPEQVTGGDVDARSDIFSLGCILYEAATGEQAFRGNTSVDAMHSILHDAPAPISELNPKIPPEVQRLIRRCLAKEPGQRFQSMKDLALELGELSEEYDQLAFRNSAGSTASGAVQAIAPRRRLAVPLLAGALVIAAIAIAMLLARGRTLGTAVAENTASVSGVEQVTFDGGREDEPAISPDGKFVAYVREDGGDSDIFLLRVGGQNAINLTASSSADESEPAFSPDGETIAFRSERDGGGIFLMGATGESVRRLTNEGRDPEFSPDGKTIVYATERPVAPEAREGTSQLKLVDVATGAIRPLYKGDAVQPQWSRSGSRVVFWFVPPGSGQRDIASVSVGGGEAVLITHDAALDWSPVWSPDGKWVWFSSNRGGTMNLWRIRVDESTGAPRGMPESMTVPFPRVGHVSFTADGTEVAFQTLDSDNRIDAMPFDSARAAIAGPATTVFRGSLGLGGGIDLSPDGKSLTFNTSRTTREDIWRVNVDGTGLTRLTNDDFYDRGPAWSPDGREIVFYASRTGKYELWTIRTDGGGLRQISTTNGAVWWPRFSPDGRSVLGGGMTGSTLLDRNAGGAFEETRKFPPYPDKTRSFNAQAWSRDGKRIAGTEYDPATAMSEAIVVLDLATGIYHRIAGDHTGFNYLAWTPDGRWLLSCQDGDILAFDPDAEAPPKSLLRRNATGSADGLAVSRDSRTLYVHMTRNEGDIWTARVSDGTLK